VGACEYGNEPSVRKGRGMCLAEATVDFFRLSCPEFVKIV
jgi:hypothetical protein